MGRDVRQAPVRLDPRTRVLAGRDTEAATLREAWGSAVAADAGVVMIVGEAGIGKTALARDVAAEAAKDGATVLQTRCYEAERSLFLQPVVEALAPVASRLEVGPLGAAAVEQLAREAGFTRFRRAAETPFNLVYEARP